MAILRIKIVSLLVTLTCILGNALYVSAEESSNLLMFLPPILSANVANTTCRDNWKIIGDIPEDPSMQSPVMDEAATVSTNSEVNNPLLLTVQTSNNWKIKYFGSKDSNGDAISATCIEGTNSTTGHSLTSLIDEHGYIRKTSRNDGKIVTLNYESCTITVEEGELSCSQDFTASENDLFHSVTQESSSNFACKTIAVLATGTICHAGVSMIPPVGWLIVVKGIGYVGCAAASVASTELCIECRFESTRYSGHCYYLGGLGKSCKDVCWEHNGEYDEDGTRDEVGSHVYGGLEPPGFYGPPECSEVLQVLLNTTSEIPVWNIGYEGLPEENGVGCYLLYSPDMGIIPAWAGTPETHKDAKNAAIRRVCACSWW